MKTSQFLQLLMVSAIWGASHSLIRITVPEWGSAITAFLRVGIAALTLMVWVWASGKKMDFRRNVIPFLIVGFLNASFPIFLFAEAAKTLPASYLVILNSATPIFNAILSSLFLADPFTSKKLLGVGIGFSGILLLEQKGFMGEVNKTIIFAMILPLLASFCYGLSAVYLKKTSRQTHPVTLTAGSSLVGSLLMLPFVIQEPWHWGSGSAMASILVLGMLGSGFAFVVYYRLLDQVGAFKASLTTFVLPVFGLFWSWLFLGEVLNGPMWAGVSLVILATGLLVQKNQAPSLSTSSTGGA